MEGQGSGRERMYVRGERGDGDHSTISDGEDVESKEIQSQLER